jgi:hypothetical protein
MSSTFAGGKTLPHTGEWNDCSPSEPRSARDTVATIFN